MTNKINIYDDLANKPNEKLAELKKLLPNFFDIDGNLIIDEVKNFCDEYQDKPDLERFTFNWAGKNNAKKIAYQNYTDGTLEFDKKRSKDFDKTENLIIEGDNLQVLKLLKKSYKGKVKCIYIDPPYNTGNDFVYNDKFELDIKQYLIETGEIDERTGEQLSDYIEKSNGKKHSKWLSFMYSRLMIARDLLTDDGVIFVSISDDEGAHLKLLMNEVFGESEVLDNIIWNSTKSVTNTALISTSHTYNFIYFKNKNHYIKNRTLFRIKENGEGFSNPDNDPRGDWKADPFQVGGWRPNQQYEVVNPKTGKIYKPNTGGSWKNDYKTYTQLIKDNRIIFGSKGDSAPQRKRFLSEALERGRVSKTLWDDIDTTTNATNDLKKILGGNYFDNPKPVSLIKRFTELVSKPNDIILDFFAGSGTTGQAVMELNQEEIDNNEKQGLLKIDDKELGKRKFILVQWPEKIDKKKEAFKAGYKTIFDITVERVKRASEKYQDVDNGFKVLKLANNPDRESLWSFGHIEDNNFVFTHLALFYGYGLNYQIEKIHKKEIYIMKAEFSKVKDAIIIMEKENINMEDVLELVNNYSENDYKFFANDKALNIELTYNLLQHFKEDNIIVF